MISTAKIYKKSRTAQGILEIFLLCVWLLYAGAVLHEVRPYKRTHDYCFFSIIHLVLQWDIRAMSIFICGKDKGSFANCQTNRTFFWKNERIGLTKEKYSSFFLFSHSVIMLIFDTTELNHYFFYDEGERSEVVEGERHLS